MTTENGFKSLVEPLAPAIARYPRPRAAIRVGAIGHRKIDGALRSKIVATVTDILDFIRRSAEESLQQGHIREQFADGLDLVVVSPLAEGADRLIAKAGLDRGYRLGAILPFAVPDCEATFDLGDRAEAVAEFRALLEAAALPNGHGVLVLNGDSTLGPDAAFAHCAGVVTRWSDILIAILSDDRVDSQTGHSVREAVDTGVPVILIDPKHPTEFKLRLHTEDAIASPDQTQRVGELVKSLLAQAVGPAPGKQLET